VTPPRVPRVAWSPSQRRAVTVIAGFRSIDGIVICADTQETVNVTKRHVSKVKLEPLIDGLGKPDVSACFCGAGDGPFVDLLTRRAWKSAQNASSLDEASEYIEKTIKKVYREYGKIYQAGKCPMVELIYGVRVDDDSRLFSAEGPIVNPIDTYCSGGVGFYMVDFLASRMYGAHLTVHQCVILAAYILFQAREHVDGCGGESHIGVLRHEGGNGLVPYSRVEAWTDLLDGIDRQLGEVLLAAADLRTSSNATFSQETLEFLKSTIKAYRESATFKLSADDGMLKLLGGGPKDELGFEEK
jgi:hypothetical protein